jgi:Zn-dependent metalloprotease
MKRIAVLTALALAVACQPATKHEIADLPQPAFVSGELGSLADTNDEEKLKTSAQAVLHRVLVSDFGATGNERMVPGQVSVDRNGGVHVRFTQEINGLPLEGASMVLHARPDGTVFGANGQFVKTDALPTAPSLEAEYALSQALDEAHIHGELLDEPALVYVFGADRKGHLAWRVTVEYENEAGPQRDIVFADAETGDLAARHPQFHYARSLETKDCDNARSDRRCGNNKIVSTSSDPISSGDLAVDSAHNYAIATYDYYWNAHGRDSINGAGMTLKSRVHWDRNYNNAFWDGVQMTYGDGDGTTFVPLSQDADVVAHELTHGVTGSTSGLIYQNESGALNEALSDIFGAMVDREQGATGADIWLLGEDIYTPGTPGDGLRDMADPKAMGDYDYYPTRYQGTSDNGGVHWNSGIANLAFVLLADGGKNAVEFDLEGNPTGYGHPRGATTVVVQPIGFQAAVDIFYAANVSCLTNAATFAEARYCTTVVHGGAHAATVDLAWDAVGVPTEYTPPPPPPPPVPLTDGVAETGQSLVTGQVQLYTLEVDASHSVTCQTSGNNGDADLYVRFGAEPETNPNSTNNACASYSSTSNESCTTGVTADADTLYAAVHAYGGYDNLSVTCSSTLAEQCLLSPKGASCETGAECCSGSCGGRPGRRTCK